MGKSLNNQRYKSDLGNDLQSKWKMIDLKTKKAEKIQETKKVPVNFEDFPENKQSRLQKFSSLKLSSSTFASPRNVLSRERGEDFSEFMQRKKQELTRKFNMNNRTSLTFNDTAFNSSTSHDDSVKKSKKSFLHMHDKSLKNVDKSKQVASETIRLKLMETKKHILHENIELERNYRGKPSETLKPNIKKRLSELQSRLI